MFAFILCYWDANGNSQKEQIQIKALQFKNIAWACVKQII